MTIRICSGFRRAGSGLCTAACVAILVMGLFAVVASAHVVVKPAEAKAGIEQTYTLRLPNEKQVATLSVELTFPEGLHVVTVNEAAGWKLEVKKTGMMVTSAKWSGSLPPKQTAEFTFTAHNPAKATVLEWRAVQVYEGDVIVEWTDAAGSKTPASRTSIIEGASSAGGSSEHEHSH